MRTSCHEPKHLICLYLFNSSGTIASASRNVQVTSPILTMTTGHVLASRNSASPVRRSSFAALATEMEDTGSARCPFSVTSTGHDTVPRAIAWASNVGGGCGPPVSTQNSGAITCLNRQSNPADRQCGRSRRLPLQGLQTAKAGPLQPGRLRRRWS